MKVEVKLVFLVAVFEDGTRRFRPKMGTIVLMECYKENGRLADGEARQVEHASGPN
jgi:hypothetical protein